MAFALAIRLRFFSGWWEVLDQPDPLAYGAYVLVCAAVWALSAYHYRVINRLLDGSTFAAWAGDCAKAVLVSAGAVSAAAFCYRGYSFSRIAIALFWTLHLAAVLGTGAVLLLLRERIAARLEPLRLLVIGSGPQVAALLPGRSSAAWSVPSASLRFALARAAQLRFLGADQQDEIRRLRSAPDCDEVLVALSAAEMPQLPAILEALQAAPVSVRVALDLPGAASVHFGARRKSSVLLVDIGASPADRLSYTVVKRALDVVIAAIALVAGAPAAAAIALLIRLSSPGPVLFRQERVGAGGRRFVLFKFRTLPVQPPDVSDRRWSATAPPEADPLGRRLRRLGLDEWPQFWNVLRGEMSIVGPRPERPHFAEGFGEALESYSLRQRLKPGITGWAQVHGYTGHSTISGRLEYDLDYLKNWSVAFDLKILLMTPLRALQRSMARPPSPAGNAEHTLRVAGAVSEVHDHARSV